jgi:hypothetical protein
VVALARGDLAVAEREASEALRLHPGFGRARDVLRRVYAERRSRAAAAPPP